MDYQIVHDGDEWEFSEAWGKAKISDLKAGQLFLIEAISQIYGTNSVSLAYLDSISTNSISFKILGVLPMTNSSNTDYAIRINIDEGDVYILNEDDENISGDADDTINLYKL